MRFLRFFLVPVIALCLLGSCSKDFDVNGTWTETPVVYGILNQNDSIHYIKVTKAFLGEGDAMMFAQIPDSSNYPVEDMEVRLEGWNGNNLMQTINFHDTLIANKDSGIFYYPTQLVYTASDPLNENYTYKLFVKNTRKNFEVTSQTDLVKDFAIEKPEPSPATTSFMPGKKTALEWYPAKGGKRYGLMVRFHYLEYRNGGTPEEKVIDWMIFNDVKEDYSTQPIKRSISGDSFYAFLKGNLIASPEIERTPREVEYIFSVAASDLNTYMEVTEPSTTIIQERPSFTNITNGIGVFSSRYDNTKKRPIIVQLSESTKIELKTNPNTADLNF